eukprot:9685108-Alexandrium_andersonii.AAC.1
MHLSNFREQAYACAVLALLPFTPGERNTSARTAVLTGAMPCPAHRLQGDAQSDPPHRSRAATPRRMRPCRPR